VSPANVPPRPGSVPACDLPLVVGMALVASLTVLGALAISTLAANFVPPMP
jgi:hypothetical protein